MEDRLVPPPEEHLTTGWEPGVPASDTLVRQAVLLHAAWPLTVARAAGRPRAERPGWASAWIGDRGAFTNWVVLLRPMAEQDSATVVAEVAEIIPAQATYFLLSAWPTPDLRVHGMGLVGHPPLMVRFPTAGSAAQRDSAGAGPDNGIHVRQVQDADELAVAEQVLVRGYPLPELEPLRRGEVFAPGLLGGPVRVWLGWRDGRALAVAAALSHAGLTLVEYVAVLPQGRGQGAGAAVTWAATLSEPEQPAVLIASDDGRPVYERMGYRAIERWTAWLRPAR